MRKSTAIITATVTALAGIGIGITGTLAITAEPVSRAAHTAPIERTDTFCDDMAGRVLDMASMLLTAWENGTAYDDTFRADNIDVYAEQLTANCQE